MHVVPHTVSPNEWRAFFDTKWRKQLGPGPNFLSTPRCLYAAQVMANAWHVFSEFMPQLLSLSCYRATSNELRAQIVQVLYEELGKLEGEYIHSEMFARSVRAAGLEKGDWNAEAGEKASGICAWLLEQVEEAPNDAHLSGILLGLEVMANENIETVFQGLCFEPHLAPSLEATAFFQVHRANEDDHIALNLENFFKFCHTKASQKAFVDGFDLGVLFWKQFWDEVQQLIEKGHTACPVH